jgi:hypothetical protein
LRAKQASKGDPSDPQPDPSLDKREMNVFDVLNRARGPKTGE